MTELDGEATNMFKAMAAGAAILALAALGYWYYPGHTFLQNDTVLYVPLLDRAYDPAVLSRDLMVKSSPLAFTIYDEVAIGLRRFTGIEFRDILLGQQFLFRIVALIGVYLIARGFSLPSGMALLVCALYSLGATAHGPNLNTVEAEPVPWSVAAPLLLLSLGLLARQRNLGSSTTASLGFLFHPISAYPFGALLGIFSLKSWRSYRSFRAWLVWAPPVTAVLLLAGLAWVQPKPAYALHPFARMDPWWVGVHQARVPYVWTSALGFRGILYYLIAFAMAVLAFRRLPKTQPLAFRFFLMGLPVAGLLSIPATYVFYERLHLAFLGPVQPMRLLLYVSLAAVLLCAVAGARAAIGGRFLESWIWWAVASLPALDTSVLNLAARALSDPIVRRRGLLVLLVGLLFALTGWLWARGRLAAASATGLVAALAPFWLISAWAPPPRDNPKLETPELAQLIHWARAATPLPAVFQFGDAGQDAHPAMFRAAAQRAVYVDWKGSGQVCYYRDFAQQWWDRWERFGAKPFDPARCAEYDPAEIDYVVLRPENRLTQPALVYENKGFLVYRTPLCAPRSSASAGGSGPLP